MAAAPPMLFASASEPTRRASIPDPPPALGGAGGVPGGRHAHPMLRSREEITDPTRMNFQNDDVPEVSPDQVVDLLSEREATIRAPA
jgi:hypothetical protein